MIDYGVIPKYGGLFVDLGANLPKSISNTWYLEKHAGYTGIAVDVLDYTHEWGSERPKTRFIRAYVGAESGKVVQFAEVRGPNGWEHQLSGELSRVAYQGKNIQFDVKEVETVALKDLLGTDPIDVMFVDLEGAEFEVLSALEPSMPRPRVLCVENVGSIAERERLRGLIRSKGYRLWGRVWMNDDIYVLE